MGQKGLYLEDDDGYAKPVSTKALVSLFRLFQNEIKCVFLNACYSHHQARAIAEHIEFVIGMNYKVSDKAAIEFATAFYDAIGADRDIPFSYKMGCSALFLENLGQQTPILIRRQDVIRVGKANEGPARHTSKIAPERGQVQSLKYQFINRERELHFLIDLASHQRKRTLVLILHAASGVGKSALTDKMIEHLRRKKAAVKIRIPQNCSDNHEDSYYLRMLAQSINEFSSLEDGRFGSLREFVESSRSLRIRRIQSHALGGLGAKGEEARRHFRSAESLLSENIALGLVEDYVQTFAELLSPIIVIENSQDIDSYSLDILREIASSTACFLILEYTDGKEEKRESHHLESFLRSEYVDVQVAKLDRLDMNHALKILKGRAGALETYVRRAYEDSDGNLRPLIDLDIQASLGEASRFLGETDARVVEATDLSEITRNHVEALPESQMFLVATVVAHGSRALLDHLYGLYEYEKAMSIFWDLEDALETLKHRRILESDEIYTWISQDRVSDAVKRSLKYSKYMLMSYEFWQEFYEKRLLENGAFFQSKSDQIVMLLICCIELNQQVRVASILDKIAEIAVASRSSRQFCRYLEMIRSDISERSSRFLVPVNTKIFKIYFYAGQFAEALEVFNYLDTEANSSLDDFRFRYRPSLLVLNHRHEEAIEICERQKDTVDDKSPEFLRLSLVELSALRSLNRHQECTALYLKLVQEPAFKLCHDFGYLLRNAQISSLEAERIENLMKEGIVFFQKRNDRVEEARSRISIIRELCNLGKLTEAEKNLDIAEDLLSNSAVETHSLLNNRAGIYIYQGKWDIETLALLRSARSTASNEFDRLIVNMNILITLSLMERSADAEVVSNSIEALLDSGKPRDKEIRRIAFYNLALHYKLGGRTLLYQRNLDRARAIDIDFCRELWDERLNNPAYSNTSYLTGVSVFFLPTFLSYWTIGMGEDS